MPKTILITGATSGIGKASAIEFAKHGWNLIITGRREDRLNELKLQLQSNNAIEIHTMCFDIRVKKEVDSQVAALPISFQKIDVLLNNAGLALGKESFQDTDESDWETMIDTNIKGLLYMTKAVLNYMIPQKSGHIINISSTAAKETYLGGNVYSATKFAVDSFSKGLRIDLLDKNIRVSAIAPGMVHTEFSEVRFKGNQSKASEVYKGFEPLMAADIAEIIYFVASRPSHVNIGDLMVTCTAQANSTTVFKEL